MNLHDQQALVGDSVYDLLEGKGTVTVVSGSEISVRFSNARSYTYNGAGLRTGNVPNRFGPLLYWHNPIIVIPPKQVSHWDALQELFHSAYKIFNRF